MEQFYATLEYVNQRFNLLFWFIAAFVGVVVIALTVLSVLMTRDLERTKRRVEQLERELEVEKRVSEGLQLQTKNENLPQ